MITLLRRASRVLVAGALAVSVSGLLSTPALASDDPAGVAAGDNAVKGEFPWMVRLSSICGGALFTPTLVLTAAHCFGEQSTDPTEPPTGDSVTLEDTQITVTQGAVDLEDPNRTTRTGDRVAIPGGFVNSASGSDWALLHLSEPIYGVPLLKIASNSSFQSGTFTAIGWGMTADDGDQQRYLKKAPLDFVDDAQCRTILGYDDLIDTEMICAGDGRPDTCKGDSGGPLVKRVGEDWVQVGITSWGIGCGENGRTAVFTEVSTFAGDICAAAAMMGGCPAIEVGIVPNVVQPLGSYFSHELHAQGGAQPYTWSVSGLPPGLVYSPATGHICGNLGQAGSFQVFYGVSDGMNSPVTNAFMLYVTRPVPDVRGKRLSEATSALQAAQFVVGTVSSTKVWDSSDGGKVMSQFPSAGTQLLPGASVNLTLGLWGGANR